MIKGSFAVTLALFGVKVRQYHNEVDVRAFYMYRSILAFGATLHDSCWMKRRLEQLDHNIDQLATVYTARFGGGLRILHGEKVSGVIRVRAPHHAY
jgi:hypothetical protein